MADPTFLNPPDAKPGYSYSITIHDHAGLVEFKNTASGTCAVAIGITSTSRIDVSAVDLRDGKDDACALVYLTAPGIEEALPAAAG